MTTQASTALSVSPLAAVGQAAPLVAGPTRSGALASDALAGRPYVLYFYPRDATPGCTTEAHDFRDQYAAFVALGVEIVGVSRDSVKSHDRFCTKESLPFPLIADVDGEVCAAWGVWQEKQMYGRSTMGIVRSTFLVDGAGTIRAVWSPVKVKGHVEAVLGAARALGGR